MSEASTPVLDAPPKRVVVRRAVKVPLPRRLLAMALIFGILALVLNALPRPYKPVPVMVVRALGAGFDDTRAAITAAESLEPVAGEATPAQRSAYKWELWQHDLGIARELVLWVAFRAAGLCLFGAVGAAAFQYRRDQRRLVDAGARLRPEVLRTETLATPSAAPAPIVVPVAATPLLPVEPPPPPIVVDRPVSFAVPDAPREPAKTPKAAVDPILAKLGFQPMPSTDAGAVPEDEEGKLPNLAARASNFTPTQHTPTVISIEPALPIGTETESRPLVRPGSQPPPDEVSIPEKTIPSPEPPSGDAKPEDPSKDPKPE